MNHHGAGVQVQLVWRRGNEAHVFAEQEPLDPHMSIQDLKKSIIPRLDNFVDMKMITIFAFHKGSILSDNTTCADAEITNGDKIIFLLKDRVCMQTRGM